MEEDRRCFKCLKSIGSEASHYGLHRSCFQVWFQDASTLFSGDLELPVFTSLVMKTSQNSSSLSILSSNFQGRYKKYSAVLGTKHYILKVKEDEYPELPATEYVCNQIAEFLGIPVPHYYFVQLEENNVAAFVVTNFMTNLQGANLKHIYHYLDSKREDFTCESIIKVIGDNSVQKKDIKVFIETCLFDSLIGNHDRHGRNLGFIETSKGKVLAPIYDNPSYVGIEELFLESDLEPKGKIATSETDNPSMRDYVAEFKKLGYTKNVTGFRKKINLEKIFDLINRSFLSVKRKSALKKIIAKRFDELINE